MKLWIFGPSSCTDYGLKSHDQSWMKILADLLGCELENYAQISADNLYIYHSLNQNLSKIQENDVVVIGWSHPNRKSFVYNPDNARHADIIGKCLTYPGDPVFFRSKNPPIYSFKDYLTLKPKTSGNQFFDTWFRDYYDDHECRLNFNAYLDSAKIKIPCQYIPFYFSKDSVNHRQINDDDFFYFDTVVDRALMIDTKNMHMNPYGHSMMAQYFYDRIRKKSLD